jgi:endonuclease/exonuclease/phosphatase (EEP) superfamily protein YafD
MYFTHKQLTNDLSSPRLKVIQANVLYVNTDYAAFIDFVEHERPDVLIVQEVTAGWLDALKALSGYTSISRIVPEDGGSGIALYSRIPLQSPKIVSLGDDKRPGITAGINADGRIVSLLTIHTHAPLRRNYYEYRNEQLAAAARYVRNLPAPKIFVGDLNTSLWSPYYADFTRQTELVDARQGFGVLPSWPTFMPFGSLLMIPIDHCLVSPDIKIFDTRVGADIGSDHLPLIVELEISAAGSGVQKRAGVE